MSHAVGKSQEMMGNFGQRKRRTDCRGPAGLAMTGLKLVQCNGKSINLKNCHCEACIASRGNPSFLKKEKEAVSAASFSLYG